jgi:ABC-type multidrug transport system fused ATPase/permease subunit
MHTGYRSLLVRYLLLQRGAAIWMSVLLLTSILFQAIGPQFLRRFIDAISAEMPVDYLVRNALLFMAIVIMGQLIYAWAAYVSAGVGWNATNAMRVDLLLHCLHLDMNFYKEHAPGEMIERVDGDVNLLGNFFSQFIVQIVGNVLLIFVIMGFIFLADVRVGLILTGYLLFATFTLWRIQGIAVPHFRAFRAAVARISAFWEETLVMLEEIKGVGALRYLAQRHGAHLSELRQRGRKAQVMFRAFVGTFAVVFAVGNALAFVAGAWLYVQGSMTLGTVYLMMYYTSLMTWTLGRVADQMNDFQQATTAIGRVKELTSTESALIDGLQPLALSTPPALEFRNVTFGYDSTTPVLHDLTFRMEAGEVLGVVGRTGSGKTSLARLLFRFYDPTTGSIRIDDVDLRGLQLKDLRASVGFVTQDVQLFHASVRDNITLFDRSIHDHVITGALDEVGLSPWLNGLADGLDTELAGSNALSAGEAQLLSFARVRLKNPRIVILDEATSRLDPLTEALIDRAVTRLLEGRTAILIAHRLHTLARADKILLLDQGHMLEFGTYRALAENPDSRFATLLRQGALADQLLDQAPSERTDQEAPIEEVAP